MTPNFALSLSFEGITLLRRMGARWARIDEVPIDHPDLDSAVIALRDRAEALDPAGAQVALIIPNEQIRYLDQPDLGGDPATREVAIRAALDGATPYAVRELKFDHVVSGGRLMVAAVAHLTLEEARVFAIEHGFTPVCFLAQAPEGAFDGAVFFGKAKGWTRAVSRPPRPIEVVEADAAALTPLPAAEQPAEPAAAKAAPRPAGTPAPPPPAAPQAAEVKPAEPRVAPAAPVSERTAPAPMPQAPAAERPATPPVATRPAPPVAPRPAAPAPSASGQQAAAPPVAPAARPAQVPPIPAKPPARAAAPAEPRPAPLPEAAPEPPVTFSTIRASRGVPPAEAGTPPLPAATAQLKPRFTPVPQGDAAPEPPRAAEPAAETARKTPPVIASPTAPARPTQAPAATRKPPEAPAVPPVVPKAPAASPEPAPKPGFFARSAASALLEQAAAAVEARDHAAPAEAPKPRKLALPKRKPGPGKPLGRPLGKAGPLAPGARPGPQPPLQREDDIAPPAAARHATQGKTPTGGKPNPLARLAALRSAGGPALPAGLAAAGAGAPVSGGAAGASGAAFTSADERARMTVFGARDRDAVGGKPRFLGLILTALLLLFLVGVAAWASVFLEDGFARLFRGGEKTETVAAAAPEPVATPLPASVTPEAAPAPAGDGVILETAAPGATADPTAPPVPAGDATEEADDVTMAAFDAPAQDPIPPLSVPMVPRALTPEEASASYAATGVWQRAPASPLTPPEDGVDDIYVASIDPDIQIFDAVALPEAKALEREPGFADPGLPPPAGLTFDFDERDLVRATPEGALTPDGLRIFTGRPPAIPPLRNSDDESRAPVTTEDTAPPVEVARLDSIARIRPTARPSDVIEQRERVQLGGISRAELARIRPQMRPLTPQEQAEIDSPEATDLAVTRSLVPVSRPRNMAAIVEQAVVEPDPVPVQTAAVAPRTVEPSLPTSASVARSATIDNAISLNKINLIGVYGTAENRRALVRLASGKYQKVKVGDSLDGGKVSAIGDDQLLYRKGGRDLVLKMPRS